MKTLLVKANTTSGVELRIYDDANVLVETKPVKITKDKICFELPENPSNRKFVNIKNFYNENVDEMELEYKEPRKLGPQGPRQTKPLEDYLDDEDKKRYLELVAKAKKAREEANKKQPMTEVEKAKRAYERALANYEKAKQTQQGGNK